MVLELAFLLGAFGAPVCLAVGVVGLAETRVPRRRRLALAVLTAVAFVAVGAHAAVWSAGWQHVDTAREAAPSTLEDALLLTSGALCAALLLGATWCLVRAWGWTPVRTRPDFR
ncbi:hypothetical protein FE697_000500 [Mumia zhuanghuii]|uniref:PEP-CTERM protein-sorting domain-containing protein n=2 Tax=Mumia TaxID=1546255 RepID=A0ABW1QTY7_9ACTN|nr:MULTISPECIES: hypothetical protein [Mumia]KAA1424449.1 hypothetical protein FE697_000500 [Mumia zhuanghuii]